jgi:hypothetical protein
MAARQSALFVGILLVGLFAPPAHGQTLLRWKLAAGQSYTVETRQHTESQVAFSGKTANTAIDLDMQLGWIVTAATADTITLKQRIERASAKLTTPQGASVQFDSAATARPTGQARQLADSLQPLIGAEVEIVISTRGELQAAKPLNEAAQKIFQSGPKQPAAGDQQAAGKAAPAENAEAGGLSRSSLQVLLRQSFIVFPEHEVKPGDEWKSTSDLTTAAGPMTQTMGYKLDEISERDGEKIARIATSSEFQPREGTSATSAATGKTADHLRIKSQEQTGQILFSITGGCLTEATLNQKLVTERPYRDVTIVVSLTSQQTTAVTAAK